MLEFLDGQKIKERSALEQKQRALERKVRKAKRLVAGSFDAEQIKQSKKNLREAQKELREFVEAHSDILRRASGREKIYTADKPKTVDNSGESGIIKIENDEFVPCLKDTETGEILETEVRNLSREELSLYSVASGWGVDWDKRPSNEYTLGVFLKNDTSPQGLISLQKTRGGIYMGFACAAPQNNKTLNNGKQKYSGVGGHLFAVAIEESLKNGNADGCVFGYAANEKLLSHYIETLGATHIPISHPFQFIIDGEAAKKILDTYNYERK